MKRPTSENPFTLSRCLFTPFCRLIKGDSLSIDADNVVQNMDSENRKVKRMQQVFLIRFQKDCYDLEETLSSYL